MEPSGSCDLLRDRVYSYNFVNENHTVKFSNDDENKKHFHYLGKPVFSGSLNAIKFSVFYNVK